MTQKVTNEIIINFLERIIAHSDKVMLNKAPLSKGQLLRYVQNNRENAVEALELIRKQKNNSEPPPTPLPEDPIYKGL